MSLPTTQPLNDFELTGFDLTNSLSIADALDTLLERPELDRSWLFEAFPRDPDIFTVPITTVPVRLSTDGTKFLPSDTNELQYHQAINTPFDLQSSLNSKLHSQAISRSGKVVIGDGANTHRFLMDLDWTGRECNIFVGPTDGKQVEFALIGKLLSMGISSNRSQLSVIVNDFSFIFSRPLQNTFYLGTGGLEGDVEIIGRPKPILLGIRDQFEPVLVDGVRRIYQINDGSYEALEKVRDQGIDTAFTFNADVADIEASTPPVNTFNTSLATGFFRLGSDPAGVVTVRAKGDNGSIYGYIDQVAGLVTYLTVIKAGLIDPGELDSVAFSKLETYTAPMGVYYGDKGSSKDLNSLPTILDAINRFLSSARAWGRLLPNKIQTVGRINVDLLANPIFEVTQDEIRTGSSWSDNPYEIEVGRVLVGYKPYDKILSDANLDAAVPLATKRDFQKTYRIEKEEDTPGPPDSNNTFTQIPDAQEVVILTDLDSSTDAKALAVEQFALRKLRRRVVNIGVRKGLIKRSIGDVLTLIDEKLPSGGPKNFVIIGMLNSASRAGVDDVIQWECYG